MKKISEWWDDLDLTWDRFLSLVALIFLIVFLPVAAWVLFTMANSLDWIERDFKIVQALQADVVHLNKITRCLEPARPEQSPGPSLGEVPAGE